MKTLLFRQSTEGGAAGGSKTSESAESKDYATEYAKSSRSTCRGCEDKIEKVKSFVLV